MPSSAARACAPNGLPARYPTTLIDARWLGDAQRLLLLRPVLPQDEDLLQAFLLAQSADARRRRFHGAVNPSQRWCQQMCQPDDRRRLALVVCTVVDSQEQLVADARYEAAADGRSADFALMVDERWQRQGIGTWALRALQKAATDAGVGWLQADVLSDNQPMLGLLQRSGYACAADPQDARVVRARRRLAGAGVDGRVARGVRAMPGLPLVALQVPA